MEAKVTAKIQITNLASSGDYPASGDFVKTALTSFTAGTGSGAVNRVFADDRTLAGEATEDLDLAGGIATQFGETLTFTYVKAIYVKCLTGAINFGTASANGFAGPFADASDRIVLAAGGVCLLVHPTTGWAVTAGTGDLLTVADNATAGATYEIIIVGVGTVA